MAKKRRSRARKPSQGLLASLRDPKKIRVAYLIAGLALVFGGSLTFGTARCDQPLTNSPWSGETPPVIAKIHTKEIYWNDWLKQYESDKRKSEMSSNAVLHPAEWEATIQYQSLRRMIDMAYFDIKAEQTGIVISEELITEQVEQWRTYLMPQEVIDEQRSILERIGDAFSGIKEEKQFELALRETDPNLTPERLREDIRQYLIAEEYVTQLTSTKDEEIMGELEIRAEELISQINENSLESDLDSAFMVSAMTNSAHIDSQANGGLIEQLKHGTPGLPPEVIAKAFDSPLGEISSLRVMNPGPDQQTSLKGVWLLTVTNRKDAAGEEWEAVSNSLRQQLLEDKRTAIEAGEAEMPEDENITVSDDEVIAAYEEADIRVIFLQAEDPMQRVSEAVRDDQQTLNITIYSPTIRAMHHIVSDQWELAGADYAEALKDLFERKTEDVTISQITIDSQEAHLRYLMANLWSTRALMAESEWMQNIWMEFQADPEAFDGAFPEPPAWIKEEQQGYFAIASKNLDRAITLQQAGSELNIPDPFYHWQRAQIDIARSQLTQRLISDLEAAHEYANEDFDLEQRIINVINQAIAMDDAALAGAEDIRPETWGDPVFPEDELGITLDMIDTPFNAMIPLVEVEEGEESHEPPPPSDTDDAVEAVVDEPALENETVDISGVEVEEAVENTEDADEAAVDEDVNEEAAEEGSEIEEVIEPEISEDAHDRPEWLPNLPIMEPNGPYSSDLRDRLDALQTMVQATLDRLQAALQAQDAAEQARMQAQIDNLPVNTVEEESGDNLLDNE